MRSPLSLSPWLIGSLTATVLALAGFLTLPSQIEVIRNVVIALAGISLAVMAWSRKAQLDAFMASQTQTLSAQSESQRHLEAKAFALQTETDQAKAEAAKVRLELKVLKNAPVPSTSKQEVVGLLALLQQKGRLLDFLMDDVTKYSDPQVGAAARVVHQGCSAVVREYFDIKPVHDGLEGAALTLPKDYDSHRYRLLGRISGEPTLSGRVLHRGWLTSAVKLPELVHAPEGSMAAAAATTIIAPAEVELS